MVDLHAWIRDPETAAVTANLLEIGRSFYFPRRTAGLAAPISSKTMAQLHYTAMSWRVRRQIDTNGSENYFNVAEPAFQDFIDDTAYSPGIIDPFDQFYWEHRMSTWHGPAMVERDFYAEPFIPFNARTIFMAMLGIPQSERDIGSLQYQLIRSVSEELLRLPINPKRWPPPVSKSSSRVGAT
ncbi:hypothetical protein [Pseudactinotalea sp. Z1748]|uniref:hypothetical protein n=1 Tax=Pseudactinotalea sp. Z1748 TaxID=3413027 RepID=UPI003C7ABFF5